MNLFYKGYGSNVALERPTSVGQSIKEAGQSIKEAGIPTEYQALDEVSYPLLWSR